MARLRPVGREVVRRYRAVRRLPEDRRRHRELKRRHLAQLRDPPGPEPDPGLLQALANDGVAVIRGFVSSALAAEMAAEVRPTMEAIAAGRYDGPLRTRRDERGGVYRLFDADRSLAPSTRAFFDDPFVAAIADALTTPGTRVADAYVDYKDKVGGHDVSVDHHVDHWKLRFKAFLLLDDVTAERAPMGYLVGSHRDDPWRARRDWSYQRHDAKGGALGAREVARISRRHSYHERVLTGRAGDLILANTRGIHHGSELQGGTRLQLVSLFVMDGPEEYAG